MNKSSAPARSQKQAAAKTKVKLQKSKARKFSTKKSKIAKKNLLTTPKRFGHVAVDAQNRILPVDYENTSLHSPYDYFYPDTSTIFDEHPGRDFIAHNYEPDGFAKMRNDQDNSITEQIPKVRASITDHTELEAFDRVMVPVLQNRANLNIKTQQEIDYELEKLGLSVEAIEMEERDWKELFTNDWKFGTPSAKMRTYTAHAILWSCTALLAYTGLEASNQYYYDIQYPIHNH